MCESSVMRTSYRARLLALSVLLGSWSFVVSPSAAGLPAGSSKNSQPNSNARLDHSYGSLPLSFEANEGQSSESVRFVSRGRGYTLFLTDDGAVLGLKGPDVPTHKTGESRRSQLAGMPFGAAPAGDTSSRSSVLKMHLIGADPHATIVGVDRLPGKANYFIGNDPKRWRTDVPTYAKVKYETVYPGIDLVYYGNQGQLEYDFVVAPGADAGQIALASFVIPASTPLRASDAASLRINSSGDLLVKIDGGEISLRKPVVYQPASAKNGRVSIDGRYRLGRDSISLEVGAYDHSRPLVIDPVLVYSTYLGGSSDDYIRGLGLDGSGNTYVAGYTTSLDFPTTPGAFQTAESGSYDVFVSKLNSTGTALVYSTYLGGTDYQLGTALAVDSSGDAFVTGITASTDFPVTSGAYQTQLLGTENDYFVSKLNPAGNGLVYSTYVGQGNGSGAGCCSVSIGLGPSGDAYIGGSTDSTAYPVTPGAFQGTYGGGGADVVFTALNPAGSALVYSTFLGGSGYEYVYGMTTDSSGNAYLAGPTDDGGFPVTAGAFQTTYAGGPNDGFVAKINPFASGSASLVFATYLGGSGNDETAGLRVDRAGSVYVGGNTDSTDFPVTAGAFQSSFQGGDYDGFVTKLNASGSSLAYSTYLGGTGDDEADVFGIDNSGNAYVEGETTSSNFPTKNAIQPSNAGGDDCFITVLNASGSGLGYFSTYLGGSGDDLVSGAVLDNGLNVYAAGYTDSVNFPTTPGVFQTSNKGGYDGFISKIATSAVVLTPRSVNFGNQSVGTTSSPKKVKLTNIGTTTLTITSISITGADSGDFAETNTCGSKVATGKSCIISVTFTPTTTGTRKAAVTIKDSDVTGFQQVALTGTGT